jgi:hypothetical protein
MGDNTVSISGQSLEELLRITRDLKASSISFEWRYYPPEKSPPYGPRRAVFTFAEAKYTTWFELKYK